MHTIRAFNPATDYETIVRIYNTVWPDELFTVEEYKNEDDNRDARYLFKRVVLEHDGQLVAFADYREPSWSYKPGVYYLSYQILPAYQKYGFDEILYEYGLAFFAQQKLKPIKITAHARDDKPSVNAFLAEKGFEVVMREPISHLDVQNFDADQFASTLERVHAQGITIYTNRELAEQDPDWQHKLWELEWKIRQDVPWPDGLTRRPFEQFIKKLEGPNYDPDGWLTAVDKGEYVGHSSIEITPATGEKVYTRLTGVAKSHRRRGLATALKVRAIQFAQAYGAKELETDNEENNPMYQLNLRLGFKPAPAWLSFEKVM